MDTAQEFVDYYERLQVDPTCDAKILEKAYRHFAQMYHPDHPETADVERFQETIEAYAVLRDAAKRAEYNKQYALHMGVSFRPYVASEDIWINEKSALDDAEAHEKILFHLYKRRRQRSDDPGVGPYSLQEMLGCSDENFQFHIWYLREKGFVEMTERGTYAITIEGVDHVISMSRTIQAEKLLIPQAAPEED